MSSSIPISGLNKISTIESEDFVPLVDSSSLTTFRASISSFGDWMTESGSASSSFSSISSSFSELSVSSSYSISSSISINSVNSITASFLDGDFTGSVFGTSSWSEQSLKSLVATSASWATSSISSSWSPYPASASWASSSISSSYSSTSSWASSSISSSYSSTSSVANNLITGNTYPVTSSWAVNVVSVNRFSPTFIDPILIDSGKNSKSVTEYTPGSNIASDSKTVILQAVVESNSTNNTGYIYISSNETETDKRILVAYRSAGSEDDVANNGQGIFPLNSEGGSLWYSVSRDNNNWKIWLIGYF